MTVQHAEELEELERHAHKVLDLFPWPDDSPMAEEGRQLRVIAGSPRTPEQVVAEQRLRDLRGALSNLSGAINGYLGTTWQST